MGDEIKTGDATKVPGWAIQWRPRAWLDRLFGYDFFISHAHCDGVDYVIALAEELRSARLRVCIDLEEFHAGDVISRITRRRLSMSRRLIVVCRPAALKSLFVREEVELFHASGGMPILINCNGSLSGHDATWLRQLAPGSLYLAENLTAERNIPAQAVIESLKRGAMSRRVDSIRMVVFAIVAVVLVAFAIAAAVSGIKAQTEARDAMAGRYAAESALELRRDPLRALEQAVAAVGKRETPATADALIAVTRALGPWQEGSDILPSEATSATIIEKKVVVATRSGDLLVFSPKLDRFERVKIFEEQATAIVAAGSTLIVGSGRGKIAAVDLETYEVRLFAEQKHDAGITSLLWLGGDQLLSAAYDNEIRIWSINEGRAQVIPATVHQSGGFRKGVVGCAFDAETRTVFTVGADGYVIAWDASAPTDLRPVAKHLIAQSSSVLTGIVAAIVWAPRQKVVVVGTSTGEVFFMHYDKQLMKFTSIDSGGSDGDNNIDRAVSSMAIDATSTELLVARWDGSVTQWSMGDESGAWPTPVQNWRAHGAPINQVLFAADGTFLTAADDRVIRWRKEYSPQSPGVQRSLQGREVNGVISAQGKFVLLWNEKNDYIVLNSSTQEVICSGRAKTEGRVLQAAVAEDGGQLALGTEFGEIERISTKPSAVESGLISHNAEVTGMNYSRSGINLAVGFRNGDVQVFASANPADKGLLIEQHTGAVAAVGWHPTRPIVASAAVHGGIISVRDFGERKIITTIEIDANDGVRGLAFQPQGTMLAVAKSSGRVDLYDWANKGAWVGTLRHTNEQPRAVAFSAAGDRLVSVADTRTVWVWNVNTRVREWQISDAVLYRTATAAFSSEGLVVITDDHGNWGRWPGSLNGWLSESMSGRDALRK